jgi:hypothetical protein
VSTYGRNLSAGDTYTDPITGVTVIKLTDSNTPVASNTNAYPSTAQTTCVSLPWGDSNEMRTVMVMSVSGGFTRAYLGDVDITTGTLSNWRLFNSPEIGRAESAVAFSNIDEDILYVSSNSQIRKYNRKWDSWVTDADFPKTITGLSRGSVLRVSANDDVFVTTQYTRQWFAYWRKGADVQCSPSGKNGQGGLTPDGNWGWFNESDSNSSYAYLVGPAPGSVCTVTELTPATAFRNSHAATMDKYIFSYNPSAASPQAQYLNCDTEVVTTLGSPGELIGGSSHFAGNWVVNPNPQTTWACVSTETTSGKIRRSGCFLWFRSEQLWTH